MTFHPACEDDVTGSQNVATTQFPAEKAHIRANIESNEDIPPCLAVVMAAYNEEATVREIAESVLRQRPVQELIVVDDGSTDGTWEGLEALKDSRLSLLRQQRNLGKGAA